MFKASLYIALSLFTFVSSASANNDFECPKKISVFGASGVVQLATKIMEDYYAIIGCNDIEVIPLPGLRSTLAFNNGEIDGEGHRSTFIEDKYTADFIRSEEPILVLKRNIWINPNAINDKVVKLGYLHGTAWDLPSDERTYEKVKFFDQKSLTEAYNKNRIQAMLSNNYVQHVLAAKKLAHPIPIKTDNGDDLRIYHYLAPQFSEAMKRISVVFNENPIKDILFKNVN